MVSIEEVKSDVKSVQGHIRPKLRGARKNKTLKKSAVTDAPSSSVDDLIEQTRLNISNAFISPSVAFIGTHSNDLNINGHDRFVIGDSGLDLPQKDEDMKAVQGILKKPSRSVCVSEGNPQIGSVPRQNGQRMRDLENDTLADELGIREEPHFDHYTGDGEQPSVKAFVKDLVVERSVKNWSRSQSQTKHETTQVNDVNVARGSMEIVGESASSPPPRIIKSLSELVSLAQEASSYSDEASTRKSTEKFAPSSEKENGDGNGDTDADAQDTDATHLEANLEFSCMSTEEYDLMLKEAELSGVSIEEHLYLKQEETEESAAASDGGGDDDDDDDNYDESLSNDIGEGDDVSNKHDSEDEGDIFDFFADNDSDEEEYVPPPPVRPFMVLWSALSDWITYEAVAVLRKHKSELFASRNGSDSATTKVVTHESDGEKRNIGVSDICLSRCAGLTTMLKMNLVKSLGDLGYNSEDGYTRRIAETRLSEFVQCFDFSTPMVKFQTEMYRALTIVLLNIVLPRHDIAYEGQAGIIVKDDTPPSKLRLPFPLSEIGITTEEYKYLVNTAIPMLDVGSGGEL